MKRAVLISAVIGLIAPVAVGAAVTWGATTDTSCWDEYNNRGTRHYRTVAPSGLGLEDCTPGFGCFWGYSARSERRNRLYVPYGADPATACAEPTTSTAPSTLPGTTEPVTIAPSSDPTTTPAPSSDPTTTDPATTLPPPTGRFGFVAPGGDLPSDGDCAARVRPMSENRPDNAGANATRGVGANSMYPRVTGDFVGTTDEIIQWVSCKWGIDEDWVRAQIVNESYWGQDALGDFTTSWDACIPGFPIGDYPPQYGGDRPHDGECPESVGLGQVRWLYHKSAFDQNNAVASSAYNLDYTYAVWRECYEGRFGWLNGLEGAQDYRAGDALGCLGVWFSGRWYTDAAIGYIQRFDRTLAARVWEQPAFPAAEPLGDGGTPVSTDAPTTTGAATTGPATTAGGSSSTDAPSTSASTTQAPTTQAPTTQAPTTAAPTTVPAGGGGGAFVADFSGNTGLEQFETGMYHRDDFMVANDSWTGDHDLDCGSPDTQRTIRRSHPEESFYLCRDHLMTSVGDTSGYSIAWFAPDRTFRAGTHTQVSFDVNVTDLGNRQWWEVSIVPVGAPFLATIDWVAGTAGIDRYDDRSVVVGKGPFGNDGNIITNGESRDPLGWSHVCDHDREACRSKAIRRTFTITDNLDGTITFDYLGSTYTYRGAFPDEFRVYFKDHNYTPDKDGRPVGHTWHWDNIVVQ